MTIETSAASSASGPPWAPLRAPIMTATAATMPSHAGPWSATLRAVAALSWPLPMALLSHSTPPPPNRAARYTR
jgi:hypothetical protein